MGLRQIFRFSYVDQEAVEKFIEGFAADFRVERKPTGLYVISNASSHAFNFDAALDPQGLVTERSGSYFEFTGIFLERLTGVFGAIEVQDL